MKVLLLAGAGWIGHNIANMLIDAGCDATVLHRSMDGKFVSRLNKNVKHILGDVTDMNVLENALNFISPDVVIDIQPSPVHTPKRCELLAGKINHFLQCSSAGVYAPTAKTPATEDSPLQQHPEFGEAFICKAIADEIAMNYDARGKLNVTIIRPGIILGSGFIPLELWGFRNPEFFRLVRDGKEILISKQTDILMSIVHVKHVADIFTQAILQPKSSKGEIFNAISFSCITHAQYLATIGSIYGVKPVVEYVDTEELIKIKSGQPMFYEGDYRFFMADLAVVGQKAIEKLGISCGITLEASLRESLNLS